MNGLNEELLQFFKTFVDIDRLKIVGVLAKAQASLPALVHEVNLPAPQVLRHIQHLKETGLVTSHLPTSGPEIFVLNALLLEAMAKRQFSRARELEPPAPDQRKFPADFTDEERKVVINFTHPNGEIKQIPLQPKKQQILIRYARHHVLKALQPDQRYTEKEISAVIKQLHPDAAFFRRNFVDTGYLDRYPNGSAYWLTEKARETADA